MGTDSAGMKPTFKSLYCFSAHLFFVAEETVTRNKTQLETQNFPTEVLLKPSHIGYNWYLNLVKKSSYSVSMHLIALL